MCSQVQALVQQGSSQLEMSSDYPMENKKSSAQSTNNTLDSDQTNSPTNYTIGQGGAVNEMTTTQTTIPGMAEVTTGAVSD